MQIVRGLSSANRATWTAKHLTEQVSQDNLDAPKKDLAFTYLFDETDVRPHEVSIFHTEDFSHYVLVPKGSGAQVL